MIETHGHVTVNEKTPSDTFNRFVDEKVKDWLGEHNLDPANTEYEVAFFDEEALGEASCLVVIHSGSHMWRAWETADEPRLALKRSLEHIKEEMEGGSAEESAEQPLSH